MAGILLQQQGAEWRLITCCSRRLSSAEENYGISDLEGLAVVYSVTKLRNYLLGKHFTILTDHCSLCALKKRVPNSPRLYRWSLLLSKYDFNIQYIRGGLHQDIDCLSRAPLEDADPYLSEKVLAMPQLKKSQVLASRTEVFKVNTSFCRTFPLSTHVL